MTNPANVVCAKVVAGLVATEYVATGAGHAVVLFSPEHRRPARMLGLCRDFRVIAPLLSPAKSRPVGKRKASSDSH
jgi:hypothetical protein